jgi:hypothetical protein
MSSEEPLSEYISIAGTRVDPATPAKDKADLLNQEQLAEYLDARPQPDISEMICGQLKAESPSVALPNAVMDRVADAVKQYPIGKPTRSIVRAKIIDERGSS